MATKTVEDNFRLYKSWYKQVKMLKTREEQASYLLSLAEYHFDGVTPTGELEGLLFQGIKYSLDERKKKQRRMPELVGEEMPELVGEEMPELVGEEMPELVGENLYNPNDNPNDNVNDNQKENTPLPPNGGAPSAGGSSFSFSQNQRGRPFIRPEITEPLGFDLSEPWEKVKPPWNETGLTLEDRVTPCMGLDEMDILRYCFVTKKFTVEQVVNAITNFCVARNSEDYEGVPKYTSLLGFLAKGVEKFYDDDRVQETFLTRKAKERLRWKHKGGINGH